ncbi:hypothetical protein [Lignipirellula cremea]|uniref:Uncharacterized protein n=1 Tax=Lignipirellula cremea TaxID=2528010 RepID=A0A518DLY6_9BACT|nr:hypothetical protein [Lignipirellula cremea]QDU92833.1 hypothetical protein Pla8534_06060 [Lignipirellula cremea]
MHIRPGLLLATVLLSALLTTTGEAVELPLQGKSRIAFATVEEAKKLLATPDLFTKSLSRFDKQARLNTEEEVTDEQFLEFAASHAQAWTPEEIERLSPVLAIISRELEPWRPLFPERVLLIKTSGKEEGDAAYTRGAAVILPARVAQRSEDALHRLLLHELFHVASRYQPELRDPLYAAIGFEACGPVATPPLLVDRRITNPDAPITEHLIRLKTGDQELIGAPILYASVSKYEADKPGGFFRYLLFRMLSMEQKNGVWQVRQKDGKPVVFDPVKLSAYTDKVGRNTRYLIHPDEILADNFVLLVREQPDVESPQVLESLRKLLKK